MFAYIFYLCFCHKDGILPSLVSAADLQFQLSSFCFVAEQHDLYMSVTFQLALFPAESKTFLSSFC